MNLPQWRPAGTLSASSASKADSSRNTTLRPTKEAVLQGDAPMDLFRRSVTCMHALSHQWCHCSAKMLISPWQEFFTEALERPHHICQA